MRLADGEPSERGLEWQQGQKAHDRHQQERVDEAFELERFQNDKLMYETCKPRELEQTVGGVVIHAHAIDDEVPNM